MDQRIELRHLRYFLAVAEELHFGRAAQRLHIAQPALSQQIRQLEKIVGVELFQRTSRSVRLTDAGASFQPRARDLLSRLAADLDEAGRVGRGESGRLDVAFITSATAIVSERLRAFSRHRPDVQVKLHDGFTVDVLTALERGTADVGIVRDAEERSGIALTPLATERLVAVVPAHHPAARGDRLGVTALAADPLILFPRSAGPHAFDLNTQPLREAGIDVQVAQECSNWHTIIMLVAAGLGITIAPHSVTTLLPPGARRLELDGSPHVSRILMATRQGDNRPLVQAFIAAPETMKISVDGRSAKAQRIR
ncbi:LysR family transcriptional regulator [Streptomyces broussonetiae]|uniref:LysR family transcriptional regulator n=1 Tax=Streptomyces broussonetiae TaxID=2686304 RepID=A0A6I6NM98_9ACTN|nr:LysR substrate-binding domain-containing protein [Streptomyces broussonetiae]QHA09037.1 LysR family transcriptional regulator [Streptomyces broussonetiae]